MTTLHDRRFESTGGLVTGASGLLGSAVARALIEAGATVALGDLPSPALAALAYELGPRAHVVPLDVTDEVEVEHAVAAAKEWNQGRLDFVFNNAAIEGHIGPLVDLDTAHLARVLMVNVVGAATVLKHALRVVEDGARIVQTGSTASLGGAPDMAPYVASKHALLGLTRVASRESAARGIRVTALLPGPIEGPMMERIAQGRNTAGTSTLPQTTILDGGRMARVDEIVDAALFLLSKESSFMTGTGMVVDGGRTA